MSRFELRNPRLAWRGERLYIYLPPATRTEAHCTYYIEVHAWLGAEAAQTDVSVNQTPCYVVTQPLSPAKYCRVLLSRGNAQAVSGSELSMAIVGINNINKFCRCPLRRIVLKLYRQNVMEIKLM